MMIIKAYLLLYYAACSHSDGCFDVELPLAGAATSTPAATRTPSATRTALELTMHPDHLLHAAKCET